MSYAKEDIAKICKLFEFIIDETVTKGFELNLKEKFGEFHFNNYLIYQKLLQTEETMYLSWFCHNLAFNPSAITQTDINEFVTHYSAPGGMRDGFN